MLHEVLFKFDDIPLDQKKGVLIDIDDTLYDYHPCHQYALQQCHIRYNKKLSQPHTLKDLSSCYRKYRLHVTEKHAPQGNCLWIYKQGLESYRRHKITAEHGVISLRLKHTRVNTALAIIKADTPSTTIMLGRTPSDALAPSFE